MKISRMNWFGMLTVLATIAGQASAVPLITLSSENFTYKYEMGVQPGSQNLDGNGTSDWFGGVSGNLKEPVVGGGVATSNHGVNPAEVLFRTDYGGSLTRATVTGDMTMEVALRLAGGDQDGGDVGAFGFALDSPGQGQSLRLNVDDDNVSFNGNGAGAIVTGDNTDAFHVYRIAYENANDFWIWRDGVLLNPNESSPFAGSNGNFNNNGSWFLGDFTGSLSGDWTVDYIRVTEDAFAPPTVPEPATTLLLMAGGFALARRRRRKCGA